MSDRGSSSDSVWGTEPSRTVSIPGRCRVTGDAFVNSCGTGSYVVPVQRWRILEAGSHNQCARRGGRRDERTRAGTTTTTRNAPGAGSGRTHLGAPLLALVGFVLGILDLLARGFLNFARSVALDALAAAVDVFLAFLQPLLRLLDVLPSFVDRPLRIARRCREVLRRRDRMVSFVVGLSLRFLLRHNDSERNRRPFGGGFATRKWTPRLRARRKYATPAAIWRSQRVAAA